MTTTETRTVVTIVRLGTRDECVAALRMAATEGVWDGQAIRKGRLIGDERWDRRPAGANSKHEWRVEQDFEFE